MCFLTRIMFVNLSYPNYNYYIKPTLIIIVSEIKMCNFEGTDLDSFRREEFLCPLQFGFLNV